MSSFSSSSRLYRPTPFARRPAQPVAAQCKLDYFDNLDSTDTPAGMSWVAPPSSRLRLHLHLRLRLHQQPVPPWRLPPPNARKHSPSHSASSG